MGRVPEVIPFEGIHPQQGQATTPGTPCLGSFASCRIGKNEELWDGAYSLLSLPGKTRVLPFADVITKVAQFNMAHFVAFYLQCFSVFVLDFMLLR